MNINAIYLVEDKSNSSMNIVLQKKYIVQYVVGKSINLLNHLEDALNADGY